MTAPTTPRPRESRPRGAVRLALGVMQLAGAAASVALYTTRGTDALTSAALSVTAAALLVSLLVFRRRELHDADRPTPR